MIAIGLFLTMVVLLIICWVSVFAWGVVMEIEGGDPYLSRIIMGVGIAFNLMAIEVAIGHNSNAVVMASWVVTGAWVG